MFNLKIGPSASDCFHTARIAAEISESCAFELLVEKLIFSTGLLGIFDARAQYT
jgi:hypothetical protein